MNSASIIFGISYLALSVLWICLWLKRDHGPRFQRHDLLMLVIPVVLAMFVLLVIVGRFK